MYGTHVLLHISVFLFFWAISDFFYTVNRHFGLFIRYTLLASAIVYIFLSISPLLSSCSPYNTPMTPLFRVGGIILRIFARFLLNVWRPHFLKRILRALYGSKVSPPFGPLGVTGLQYYKGIHFDRARFYSMEAEKRAEELEKYAMEWLFTEDDFGDDDMDKFLEGLPGYMSSSRTKKGQLDQYLTTGPVLSRIKEHLMTCATSVELSDGARIARVTSCVKAFWLIFQYSLKCKEYFYVRGKLEEELNVQEYIQGLMDDFQTLCGMEDPVVALRASCIRALAVQGLLSPNLLVPPDSRTAEGPPFPVYLLPIYKFLFPNDKDNIRLFSPLFPGPDSDVLDAEDLAAFAEEFYSVNRSAARPIWDSLLQDKPLVNLTTIGQAVLEREHAPPSTLSFCWKALDVLLSQIRTSRFDDRTRAQIDFDKLHKNTRAYVHDKELGFRIRPLLDILDTVSRRRRLLMVFSPDTRYHHRVDLVFGKKDFRNGDLLKAFAHCLPNFIRTNHNLKAECMNFMEKVVSQDNLWTSLQANLWDTQRSDIPIPEKVRVFEDYCAVLDLALSALQDSRDVDWHSPELWSLLQHFELFQESLIQGASMGRANSFRIGIIKARFCKALLAQVWGEGYRYRERRKGISFADFWNSYVSGGHIGAEFPVKALDEIYAECDGPLLIFCFLGDLVVKAVPVKQSDLEVENIKKVLELQEKVIHLPIGLNAASAWEALDQLQEQVNDLRSKDDEDKENLLRLREMINYVNKLRIPDSEGHSQRKPAEEQGPNTSVAANPTFDPSDGGQSGAAPTSGE